MISKANPSVVEFIPETLLAFHLPWNLLELGNEQVMRYL
jgi:hypothetical protein